MLGGEYICPPYNDKMAVIRQNGDLTAFKPIIVEALNELEQHYLDFIDKLTANFTSSNTSSETQAAFQANAKNAKDKITDRFNRGQTSSSNLLQNVDKDFTNIHEHINSQCISVESGMHEDVCWLVYNNSKVANQRTANSVVPIAPLDKSCTADPAIRAAVEAAYRKNADNQTMFQEGIKVFLDCLDTKLKRCKIQVIPDVQAFEQRKSELLHEHTAYQTVQDEWEQLLIIIDILEKYKSGALLSAKVEVPANITDDQRVDFICQKAIEQHDQFLDDVNLQLNKINNLLLCLEMDFKY